MSTHHVRVTAVVDAGTVSRVEVALQASRAGGLLVARLTGSDHDAAADARQGRARIEVLTTDERANGIVAVLLESAAMGAEGGNAIVRVTRPTRDTDRELAPRR